MKITTKWIAAAIISAMALVGCSKPSEEAVMTPTPSAEPTEVHVSALKGPTSMGMVQLMSQNDKGEITSNQYHFEIMSAVDEVAPKLLKGEIQIAAVPANLGAVLYKNSEKKIEVLAINTLGVLSICETGDMIHSVADLKGKTIYAAGKGATPEYVLNYILSENGLEVGTDVTIEWKSEHAECVAAMAQDASAIAMLPQPFVTAAQGKNDKIHVALDLTKEWDSLQETKEMKSALITGVVVARKDFIEEHPEAVEDFLNRYEESVSFVNGNVEEAAALIGGYDIVPEPVAKKAIPFCNIVCIRGKEMQEKLSGYLAVLFEQNPKSTGGELPDQDFYYGVK